MKRIFLDAVSITVVFSIMGLVVNAWFHPHPLEFIADEPYETMIPCPVPGGDAVALSSKDERLLAQDSFIIDARGRSAFAAWHLWGAMNVPFDYLDPTPPEVLGEVARKVASSRARRVVVYGDGQNPDTGEQLAKELSGKGIKNIFFVEGGAGAIMRDRGRP
jgi:hypothetical protein